MQLRISYYGDTDTLSLWNGAPASAADDVADNLIVDYDAEGDAVGFTLDHAAELLLPLLTAAKPSAQEGKPAAAAPVKMRRRRPCRRRCRPPAASRRFGV